VAISTRGAVACFVQGVLHLVYHAGHLRHFDGFDKIALLRSLIAAPVLAGIALVTSDQHCPP
jgi:hypothetical protein